ncbi:MAG TPA: biotin/lipoyl-containing protein [Thermodesulfobacteriota bacterium]|nr:biotin/lipoyl-containing protein [Thermodesulfobacteriota bacterium]
MTYTFKIRDQIYKITLEKEDGQLQAEIEGTSIMVDFEKIEDDLYSVLIDGRSISIGVFRKGKKVQVFIEGELYELEAVSEREQRKTSHVVSGIQEIKSPMPSRVVKILKGEGDEVGPDEGLIVVEAMKMESELKSPIAGKVKNLMVKEGDAVESGAVLLVVSSE